MQASFRVVRTSWKTWQVIANRHPLPQIIMFETGNKMKAEAIEEFLSNSDCNVRLKRHGKDRE